MESGKLVVNNAAILDSHFAVKTAYKMYADTVKEQQLKCPHNNVGECDYESLSESYLPPIRVCMDCGLSEEGWGVGHVVLNKELVYKLPRDKVYQLQHSRTLNADDKGKLLRKECSLTDLLKVL